MTEEQRKFLNAVVLPVIAAGFAEDWTAEEIDRRLTEAAEDYNQSEDVRRARLIENLSHYICGDDVEGALRLLEAEAEDNPDESADNIVTVWQPLEGRYTVAELLNLIGY
jgi:hypothetical protein